MQSQRPPLHQADDIELLLQSKAVPPIPPEHLEELKRIANLDVSTYSEADVRAEIIDPIVRALGYSKETFFSLQREKHLKVLDGDLFIDYNMTLWSEAFWLIEAKKVAREALKFTSKELQQALQYASHPEINAALVVLCDGRVIEIYDREESVTKPSARVEVKNLPSEFHVLQALLSPWQAWFFQKRRVLRLIDKVLDYEMIPSRLEEFKDTISTGLARKRAKVIENWRTLNPISNDRKERLAALESMSVVDIIEGEFFTATTDCDLHDVARTLAKKAVPDTFRLIFRLFPERPRPVNDNYVIKSLCTTIALEDIGAQVNLLPNWLQGGGLEGAIKRLIALGLTSFDADKSRKLVLQYSAASRRIAKMAAAHLPQVMLAGLQRHAVLRFLLPELHFAQITSTPSSQVIAMLDGIQVAMTERFIRDCMNDRKEFDLAKGETALRDIWQSEATLLGDGSDYWKNIHGRGLRSGDSNLTEYNWINHDGLGHLITCVIERSTKWRDYAIHQHTADLSRLAKYGSWQASKLLGFDEGKVWERPSDEDMANRFFYGDIALFKKLRDGYKYRQPN